jgi:hypothetical protein
VVVIGKALKEDDFEKILNEAITIIKREKKERTSKFSPSDLEKEVARVISLASKNLNIPSNVELISGKKFPDVVCEIREKKLYGIEVKSTKSDEWICLGNSINESTRIDGLEKIYVFFGKLGGEPDFRYAKYEEILEEVRITHYPRYFINMNCSKSIFDKMNTEYDEFRTNPDMFKILKSHYRKQLKQGEELWWMDNQDITKEVSIIKMFSEMDEDKKEDIISEAFIYFTELFNPKDNKKYTRLVPWLVSKYQLVSPNIRDHFSAGGKVEISGYEFPQVVKKLFESIELTLEKLATIDKDDLAYYWKKDLPQNQERIVFEWQTRIMNNLALGCDKDGLAVLRREISKWLKPL